MSQGLISFVHSRVPWLFIALIIKNNITYISTTVALSSAFLTNKNESSDCFAFLLSMDSQFKNLTIMMYVFIVFPSWFNELFSSENDQRSVFHFGQMLIEIR